MLSKLFRVFTLLPIAYWLYLIIAGDLGADPAKSLNHKSGEIVLYYIMLNLLVGVLISFRFRWPILLRFLLMNRRWLGVLSFLILMVHVVFYFFMEAFEIQAIEQLYTKNYLMAASFAFVMLLLMALTSNDFSVRKIGARRWKNLHRIVYLASFFFTMHILLIEKTDLQKYGLILGGLWIVQTARFIYKIVFPRILGLRSKRLDHNT